MAITCPQGSICSLPYTANVGTNQTNLYFYTSTNVTQDSTGRVNGGTTTLYYSPTPGNYVPSATTSDGGKTWNYIQNPDGSYVLGDDARRSLQEGVLKTNTNTFIKDAAQKSGIPEQQAKNLQLNQNTASSNAPEPGQSGAGETPIDLNSSQENLSSLKISDDPNTRAVGAYPPKELLRYPITMSGDQDYVQFTMLKYASRGINLSNIAEGSPLGERGGGTRERGSTVVLPIQPTISDSNVVKWGSNEMDAGQLIAAAAALGTITEGPEGAISALQAIKELIGGSAKNDLKTTFAAGFADAAAGTKGLLTRVTGGIVNPNMELLFQGPDLRTFNFTFTLSAREPKEAKVIRNIIRFFKQGMSVKRASTALFLKSPHTFEIKYIHKGDDHPWINRIKECALTSCNVNYTPAGNYATYEDGAMTQYDISLSFSELEPIYDDDYKNFVDGNTTDPDKTEIGY